MASLRICLAIAFAVLAVSVHASDFTEDAEDTVMLQAKASVAALKKKGATNADCVDLANTMCKTVEKEQNTDQKLMDRLKDGRQCVNLGLKQVIRATAHLKKTRAVSSKMEVNVRSSHNAKVHMGVHRFSSLRQGKCGQFFTSRAYRVAHHRYTKSVKIAASWRGRVKESIKMLVNAKRSRARQVKRCHCQTRKARDTMWRTVTKRSRVARQIKAHQKCKMMACVLKGTSLRNRSCRASLKRVRTKKLIKATENVRGCSSKPTPKQGRCPGGLGARKHWKGWTCSRKKTSSYCTHSRWKKDVIDCCPKLCHKAPTKRTKCGNVALSGKFKNVVLGCAGQSCTQACKMISKRCDAGWEKFIHRQRNVPAFMRSMAKSFGRVCKTVYNLHHTHRNSPYTHPKTGHQKGTWCSAGNGKHFSCNARHPADRRYCRCR